MNDPHVRVVGHVEGMGGEQLFIGVDHDSVAIYFGAWLSASGLQLESAQAEEFASLFVGACWEAAAQRTAMTDAQLAELKAAAEEIRLADHPRSPLPERTRSQ